MNIGKKDWIFVGIILVVLVTFWAISGKEKTKYVPNDAIHKPFYDVMKQTGSKAEAEKGCEKCHNEQQIPFPKGHPPPNRCLFCHKMHRPA